MGGCGFGRIATPKKVVWVPGLGSRLFVVFGIPRVATCGVWKCLAMSLWVSLKEKR